MNKTSARDWLDSTGRFLFGKYEGRTIEYVAMTDHSYIKWVVEAVEDISDEDREIMKSHLSFLSRR